MTDWQNTVRALFEGNALVSAVLSDPLSKTEAGRKTTIRPVSLRGEAQFQFERFVGAQTLHTNFAPDKAAEEAVSLLLHTFRQGQFFTKDADVSVLRGAENKAKVSSRPPTKALPDAQTAPPQHNRSKSYLLPENEPIPFLQRLGVQTSDGKIVAAKRPKFKQINRFLEIVNDVYSALPPSGPLRVVDFGCGKSYLTFALHHYLTEEKEREADIVGLDLKADTLAACGKIAEELSCAGLRFETGAIGAFEGVSETDMVVALHACDTATDDALQKAVASNARVILAAPCCQHELYGQIENAELAPLLKHGILKERFAALLTDALRAEWLEAHGYRVQVLEFIASEHTAKNLLLRAVRRESIGEAERARHRAAYEELRDRFGARPSLDTF